MTRNRRTMSRTLAAVIAAAAGTVMLMPAAHAAGPSSDSRRVVTQIATNPSSQEGKPCADIAAGAVFSVNKTTNYGNNNDKPDDGVFTRMVNKTGSPLKIKVKDAYSDGHMTLQPGQVMWLAGYDINEASLIFEVHSEDAAWGTVWFNDPWFFGDNPEAGLRYYGWTDKDDFTVGKTRGMSKTEDHRLFKTTMAIYTTLKGSPESLHWSQDDYRAVGKKAATDDDDFSCHKDWQVFDLSIEKMERHY